MGLERHYRVGELAHLCEVNPRTVDYYTSVGLLLPIARSRGGHRLYGEDAAWRLRAIRGLQAQGCSLGEIRERLATIPDGELLPRIEQLCKELRQIEAEVAALAPQLAQADARTHGALRSSLAGAAGYAMTVAQELTNLLNRDLLGVV